VCTAALSGCGTGTSPGPSQGATPVPTASPTTGLPAGQVDTITIKGFAFPALTVKPGATVHVVNADQASHTATRQDGFDTGTIAGGATGSFGAPKQPGAYDYVCSIHPFMKGTLTVAG